MALKKPVTTIQGVVAEYWRITRYDINVVHGAIEIELMPYVSQESRLAGNQPFESNRVLITEYNRPIIKDGVEQIFNAYNEYFAPAALEAANMNLVEAMYTYVKNNVDFFNDAEDV